MKTENRSSGSLVIYRALVISLCLFGVNASYGQIDALVSTVKPQVVHDPVANANAITTIGSIGNMVAGINAQIELLEKASEKLSKVSGYFQTLELIDEIMITRKIFYEESQLCMKLIDKAKGTFGVAYFQGALTGVYGTTRRMESELGMIDALLTNNLLTMSTSERIVALRKIKEEIQTGLGEVRAMRYNVQRKIALYYYRRMYLENYGKDW